MHGKRRDVLGLAAAGGAQATGRGLGGSPTLEGLKIDSALALERNMKKKV
jgi:hypothetical protein